MEAIMCKEHSVKTHHIYLLATILGIILGLADITIINSAGKIISDIFIKIFKCISLPIISLSIIVTLAGMSSGSNSRTLWIKTLSLTFFTTLLAAFVAFGTIPVMAAMVTMMIIQAKG